MTTYGLLSTGFVPKTAEIIRAEVDALFFARYGNSFDMSDEQPQGWLVGIMSEREALIWELLEAIVASRDPDAAFGVYLDTLLALSGAKRIAAQSSTVTLTLTGTDATSVPAASQISNQVTTERFDTSTDAVLVDLTVWALSTAYVLDDRRSNGGNCYICTGAGTSAGSGGPTTELSAITDGTVTWRFLGNGIAAVDVAATSSNTGPVIGTSGDLNVIENPVSGWDSVINILDATLGAVLESDGIAKLRRETVLATGGTTPVDALRTDLLTVDGVTSVRIFENNTDATDANGVPAHSIEALIQGGTDQDIWTKLHTDGPAGYNTYGTVIGTATDTLGNVKAYAFSRPTEVEITHELTVEYDVSLYPTDGDTQIKLAIVAYGDAQNAGRDASPRAATAAAMGIVGVTDVPVSELGSPGVVDANYVIGSRELAVYDTSRITITSSAVTP